MTWQPIDDKTPRDRRILLWADEECWIGTFDARWQAWRLWGNGPRELIAPSHWQPLPAGPQEKTDVRS